VQFLTDKKIIISILHWT